MRPVVSRQERVGVGYSDSVPILLLPLGHPLDRQGVAPLFTARDAFRSVEKRVEVATSPERVIDALRSTTTASTPCSAQAERILRVENSRRTQRSRRRRHTVHSGRPGPVQEVIADVEDCLGQPEVLTDPLPTLLELQGAEPLYWSAAWGVWVLTRYDDVIAVLEDPTTYSSEQRFTTLLDRLPAAIQPRIARLRRHYSYGLIQSDPPTHTRLRLMVRDAFTPRAMAAFSPTVEALADTLIDRFADRGSVDLMAEFAYVLPISVMCELMAVPVHDRQKFVEWDTSISGIQSTGAAEGERALAANDAIIAIEDYFFALARERRAQPGTDLVSLMLTGHRGLEPLGDQELMAMCVGLLLGGHETTRSLIGSLMLCVLARPALLDEVRRRPDIIPHVVEEVLRFESPIQRGWRRVTRDVEVHGQCLQTGDLVYVMLGAANRDQRRFDEAAEFLAERRPNQHLGFGYGIHFCIGAPLARLEASVALERLSGRLDDLHLAGSVAWLPSVHQRTLERLGVEFSPRRER